MRGGFGAFGGGDGNETVQLSPFYTCHGAMASPRHSRVRLRQPRYLLEASKISFADLVFDLSGLRGIPTFYRQPATLLRARSFPFGSGRWSNRFLLDICLVSSFELLRSKDILVFPKH